SLKKDKGATTKAANIYSGRSILTPHARAQLAQQMDSYIFKEVFPLYYKAKSLRGKGIPLPGQKSDDLEQRIKEVEDWYLRHEKSPLRAAPRPDEDTGVTAFRGRKDLKDTNSLSQSLGGFNEALLMHKQTPQLSVSDPLGFADYQPFAVSV